MNTAPALPAFLRRARARRRSAGPQRRTVTIAALLVALGALALLTGGIGLTRATLLSAQIPFVVSGGIGGLVLITVGLHLFVGTALGRERDRLDGVAAAISTERHRPGRPSGA